MKKFGTEDLHEDGWRQDSVDESGRERGYRRSCCECLMIVPLFVVFMLLQYTHMSLMPSYLTERVLKFEFLSKRFGNHSYTVKDVHDSGLFWEWLEVMLDQTVAIQHDQLGHELPRTDWGFITRYNRIVGGVRLEQDRGTVHPCEGSPEESCYSQEKSTRSFGYPSCGAGRQGVCYDPRRYAGYVNVEGDEGFVIDNYTGHFEMWLDTKEPKHTLKKRVEYLEDRNWIDKQTRMVVMELLVRNDQFEPLVSEVIFEFHFDRTGYIKEAATVETIPASPYSTLAGPKIFLASLHVLLNVGLIVYLLRAVRVRRQRALSLGRACRHALEHNAVEAVSFVVAAVQISLWCVYVPSAANTLDRIKGLKRPGVAASHRSADEHLWVDYHHEIADIEMNLKWCVKIMRLVREFSALTLLCLLIRTFKVWAGIPAFSTVTRTLQMSATRLGAVMVSAGTLLALFSGAAMLNYGTQLEEFYSITSSLQQTAIISISGDAAAYEKMADIDPVFAAFWFWGLVAVMFMVVLNLILGILVDAASAAGGESTPIGLMGQFMLTLRWAVGRRPVYKKKKTQDPTEEALPDKSNPDPEAPQENPIASSSDAARGPASEADLATERGPRAERTSRSL